MSEGGSIRILAVDDHVLIVVLISSEPNLTLVAEASNGRGAIQQFRAHRPDITLMDMQMPEMNGLDAIIAIRAEFPDATIIVLTTYKGDVRLLGPGRSRLRRGPARCNECTHNEVQILTVKNTDPDCVVDHTATASTGLTMEAAAIKNRIGRNMAMAQAPNVGGVDLARSTLCRS